MISLRGLVGHCAFRAFGLGSISSQIADPFFSPPDFQVQAIKQLLRLKYGLAVGGGRHFVHSDETAFFCLRGIFDTQSSNRPSSKGARLELVQYLCAPVPVSRFDPRWLFPL